MLDANAEKLASYTLSQICQELKEAVGVVMTQEYPIRVGNTESNRAENCAPFTFLSDRAQGYKFLYYELKVCVQISANVTIFINGIRDEVAGSPISISLGTG